MTKSLEDMFHDPDYESISCQKNCGFVIFWRRGEDGNFAVSRLGLHKARGCEIDQEKIIREGGI